MIDGKSQAWRDAADKLLEALARENQYIVADMLIIFLESASYGLDDYTPLGGVFKRAAKKGIIKKVDAARKQALWRSNIYKPCRHHEAEVLATLHEIYPDWQHVKLTRIGYAEQRMATIFKLRDYIVGATK